MAAGSTYTPIATFTVTSAQASYTFSSIPSTYTDLVLITVLKDTTSDSGSYISVGNGSVDTGSNYSDMRVVAYPATNKVTQSNNNTGSVGLGNYTTNGFAVGITNFMNYANTTAYKNIIGKESADSTYVQMQYGTWRSTSAINIIQVLSAGSTFAVGSTLTLYGIAAA